MIENLTDEVVCIKVPIEFPQDHSLSYNARIVSMAIQTGLRLGIDPKALLVPAYLAGQLKKTEKTIAKAIAELEASRWEYDKPFKIKGKFIEVSNMLILDKHLTNCAKLLFCFILIVRELAGGVCVTRFSELHKMFRLGFNTVKRGMVALQAGKWLYSRQENKHAPIRIWTEFPLRKPLAVFNAMVNDGEQAEHTQSADGKADNRRQGTSLAERLVLGALTLIVNSDYYDDHYTPKFFPDWGPDHQMHFDRLYHREVVAIEYNGLQHYQATEWFDADVVAQQQWCDKFKSKICKINNVKLIVLTVADFSVEKIKERLRGHLPLRELPNHLVELINKRFRDYLKKCRSVKPQQETSAAVG